MFTHDTLVQLIQLARPGAKWSLRGDTLDGLQWDDTTQAKPTESELTAFTYQGQRESEYPSIYALADALVHQKMGDGGAALDAYLQKCIDIKTKYPKPL